MFKRAHPFIAPLTRENTELNMNNFELYWYNSLQKQLTPIPGVKLKSLSEQVSYMTSIIDLITHGVASDALREEFKIDSVVAL